jgi:oxygen-independent coproporphyrinogen-3 oxidase
MTRLRTAWGVSPAYIGQNFGKEKLDAFLLGVEPYISTGHLQGKQDSLILTKKGKLLADKIAFDLFI